MHRTHIIQLPTSVPLWVSVSVVIMLEKVACERQKREDMALLDKFKTSNRAYESQRIAADLTA